MDRGFHMLMTFSSCMTEGQLGFRVHIRLFFKYFRSLYAGSISVLNLVDLLARKNVMTLIMLV
jgi:hypothetical protein